MPIKHARVSAAPDDPGRPELIQPSDWNAGLIESFDVLAGDATLVPGQRVYCRSNDVTAGGDPYFPNVRFLMDLEGGVSDYAGHAVALLGTAVRSGAAAIAGAYGLALPGLVGSRAQVTTVAADFALGNADFTLEADFVARGAPSSSLHMLMGTRETNGNYQRGWHMFAAGNASGVTSVGFHYVRTTGEVVNISAPVTRALGVPMRVAVSSDALGIYIFLDGVKLATATRYEVRDTTDNNHFAVGGVITLEPQWDSAVNGDIDNVRVTIGTCRYDATHTPEETFPASSGVMDLVLPVSPTVGTCVRVHTGPGTAQINLVGDGETVNGLPSVVLSQFQREYLAVFDGVEWKV